MPEEVPKKGLVRLWMPEGLVDARRRALWMQISKTQRLCDVPFSSLTGTAVDQHVLIDRGEHVLSPAVAPATAASYLCLRALVYVASVPRRVRTVSGTRSRARPSSHCKCGTNITSES